VLAVLNSLIKTVTSYARFGLFSPEQEGSSETSATMYQSTWHNIQDLNVHVLRSFKVRVTFGV
jgi:hypothetical protein